MKIEKTTCRRSPGDILRDYWLIDGQPASALKIYEAIRQLGLAVDVARDESGDGFLITASDGSMEPMRILYSDSPKDWKTKLTDFSEILKIASPLFEKTESVEIEDLE